MNLKWFAHFAIFACFSVHSMNYKATVKELRKLIREGMPYQVTGFLKKLDLEDKEKILKKASLIYYAVTAKKLNPYMVDLLLGMGANPNKHPKNRQFPIVYVFNRTGKEQEAFGVLNKLIDNPSINLNIPGVDSPIILALDKQLDKNILEKIIRKTGTGFLNPKDSKGMPALIKMLREKKYDDLSKLIITKGADVNQCDDTSGATSLMALVLFRTVRAREDIEALINLLIQHRARINDKDNEGQTALMHFAQHNDSAYVYGLRVLISWYKHLKVLHLINEVDNHGKTALILAAENPKALLKQCTLALEYLLLDGYPLIDVNIKDKSGFDALYYAIKGQCPEKRIKRLLDYGAHITNISTYLNYVSRGYRESIERLLEQHSKDKLLALQSLTVGLNSLVFRV